MATTQVAVPPPKRKNTMKAERLHKGVKPALTKPPARDPVEFRELVRAARNLIAHTTSMEDVIHQLRFQAAQLDGVKVAPSVIKLSDAEEARVKRAIAEAETQLYGMARQPRELVKGRQLARLEDTIVKAKAKGDHSAVVAAEREVAKIMGTYAPVQVRVGLDAEVEQTLQVVVASLGRDTIAALLRGERPPIGLRSEILATGDSVESPDA